MRRKRLRPESNKLFSTIAIGETVFSEIIVDFIRRHLTLIRPCSPGHETTGMGYLIVKRLQSDTAGFQLPTRLERRDDGHVIECLAFRIL
ncbi:hypothetical protein WI99_20655 [Burkholderia cepacia]|nr:hypothetical protein WI99_20655 [Burkholderia cepacia]KVH66030.1 hypothetical protein WJ40_08695 [Burkholderia cepacia]KVQ29321.1 hypothetical protein WK01_14575 [Burkholderia cepacia]KVW20772.1 hypothetical protein WK91_05995 [Burkholderia cepacia]